MKKVIRIVLLFVLIVAYSTIVKASDVRQLKTGKTYNLDLNGGKKEKVKVSFSENRKKDRGTWNLYVNKKKVYSYTIKGNEPFVDFYYLDVDKSDKYHEFLFISKTVNSWLEDSRVIRFYNNKKVKALPLVQGAFAGKIRRIYFASSDGDGRISFYMDSPFINMNSGFYHCLVSAEVGSNNMAFLNRNIYDLEKQRGSEYRLNRSMYLYGDEFGNSKIKTLNKGTVFTTIQVRPVSKVVSGQNGEHWDLFFKITTSTGETGWIYFPNSAQISYGYNNSNRYLVTIPLWG